MDAVPDAVPRRYPPVPEGSTAFLEIPKLADEDGLIVARGEHCYVVLNLFPYNPDTAWWCRTGRWPTSRT
ncbi:hypothetical protein MTP03_21160 [Tsukamurella sp. PLM1]|nr:hypothetical protein MTP03_21160 [Tsukamurella sp. PLM1]